MKLSRRTFFKVNAAGAAALVAAPRSASAAVAVASPDARGVLVDTTRCVGCRACEAACAEANTLGEPADAGDDVVFTRARDTDQQTFTVVNRFPKAPAEPKGVPVRFAKTQCMHCVEPACASACPVARAREERRPARSPTRGNRCLGCRYCMVACPFDVPKYEYDKTQPLRAEVHLLRARARRRARPACTEVCPTGALHVRQPRASCSRRREDAHLPAPRPVRAPRLRRARGRRHELALHLRRAAREARAARPASARRRIPS